MNSAENYGHLHTRLYFTNVLPISKDKLYQRKLPKELQIRRVSQVSLLRSLVRQSLWWLQI